MPYNVKVLQTDVCIVGGGLSGSLAALQARQAEVDVVVLEKANTQRSGNAGTGIDHVFSYIPPLHEKVGYSREDMKADQQVLEMGKFGLQFSVLNDYLVDHSYERIIGLEKYGLKFRFEDSKLPGKFRVVPQFHSVPTSFNFEGRDIKPLLTKAMRKAGVEIVNRAFVVELLKAEDGGVAGAIAVSSREETIYVVQAKTTVLATAGGVDRLSKAPSGTDFERFHSSGQNNGAGKVLAAQAGADVLNMEFTLSDGSVEWMNWSMGAGSPHGTYWACGQVVDEDGHVVVERGFDHDTDDPEYCKKYREQAERYAQECRRRSQLMKEGKALYLDFSAASDEEIAYVTWSLGHEGKCNVLLRNMERQGIRFQDVQIPYFYSGRVKAGAACSGVFVNERCETSVSHLYAAGNEIAGLGNNSAPEAVVFGIEAGIQAAQKAKELSAQPGYQQEQVEQVRRKVEQMYCQEEQESNWLHVEHAVQDIVSVFGRTPYTDDKCKKALFLLEKLERDHGLHASCPHEICRCFDALFLIVTAKLLFTAGLQRQKNLGPFLKGPERPSEDRAECMFGLHKEQGTYVVTQYPAG